MFKSAPANPYDDIVGEYIRAVTLSPLDTHPPPHNKVKATDETLTSENWEIILNLCDKVQDEGEQG
jgi:hypothetical protein